MNLFAKCGQGTQDHVCETLKNILSNKKMETTNDYTTVTIPVTSQSYKAYHESM
jgi:hypothetical protein